MYGFWTFTIAGLLHFPSALGAELAKPDSIEPVGSFFFPGPERNQDEACRELAPGESRGVNERESDGSTPRLRRVFRITKQSGSPNRYNVEIPVKFQLEKGVFRARKGAPNLSDERESLDRDHGAQFIASANVCFDRLKQKIKDPDGNEFHLRFVPKAKDPKTEPIEISLSKADRSNAFTYDYNIDCPAIVHEALHLMGLVDTYPEPLGWTCRPPPSNPDTIMFRHSALVESFDSVLCQCRQGNCMLKVPAVVEVTDVSLPCPQGYENRGRQRLPSDFVQSMIAPDPLKRPMMLKEYLLMVKKIPEPPFTLTKKEAQFLIKPHCTRDNNYLACTRNHHRTKEVHGCAELPKDCE